MLSFRRWTKKTLENLGISINFSEDFAAAFPGVPYIDDLKKYPTLVQTLLESTHINPNFFTNGDFSKEPSGLHSFLRATRHVYLRNSVEGAVDAMVVFLFNLLGLADQGPLM